MKTNRGRLGDRPSGRVRGRIKARPDLEVLDRRELLTTYVVSNNLDSGTGSLRDAITQSNADNKQANEIDFNILPAGLAIITPASASGAFPAITNPVTILGSTQPRTDGEVGPAVEIDGTSLGNVPAIFTSSTNGVTFDGMSIINAPTSAIALSSGGSDIVQGCYIGVAPSGTRLSATTGVNGILVSSASNTIGGTTAATRNVISGWQNGIELSSAAAFTVIQGNYIGTNATGTAALNATNAANGIDSASSQNTIGGFGDLASGVGNVISGWQFGINLNGSSGNTVAANLIGTDATGNAAIGNAVDGIIVGATSASLGNKIGAQSNPGASGPPSVTGNVIAASGRNGITINSNSPGNTIIGNKIGIGYDNSTRLGNGINGIFLNAVLGTSIGKATLPGNGTATERPFGNVIAFNGFKAPSSSPGAGILINGGQTNGILSNSIYGNAGLGIQIAGENFPVSAPVVSSALSGGNQTRIAGSIFEQPLTSYRIQIFSSTSGAPGNGQTFVEDYNVTTNSAGFASINQTIGSYISAGLYLTATATQNETSLPNSSPFSSPVQVGQAIISDLQVTQTTSATNPLVGQPFTYTITVTNNGPDAATGVTIADTLPANSTLISTNVGSLANGVLTISAGTIAKGNSETFSVVVRPNQATTAFTNTVVVSGDNIDPVGDNDTSVVTSTVLNDADLSLTLTPSSNPAPIGTPLTFILTITNQGPSTANNPVTVITLPSDYTNIVASPDQGSFAVSGSTLTISSGILASGVSSTVTITATPGSASTETTTATVSNPGLNGQPDLVDPDPSNNTASAAVTGQNAADLGLTISGSPSPVLSSQTLLYTIVVTNNGPSDATNPVVTDILPAGFVFDPNQSSASDGTIPTILGSTVTATLNQIAAGASTTIIIAVTPQASGRISNTASVADTNEIDPDTTNNTASTVVPVNPADLTVAITNPNDPLLTGVGYVYSVVVTNNGPADATNVVLKDIIQGSAQFSAGASGTISGSTLTQSLGTIASGQSITVMIPVTPGRSGTLGNQAIVSADQLDIDTDNNTETVSNLVEPVDLGVTVAGSPTSAPVGSNATFTIVVSNAGPTAANNVNLNIALPGGLTFASIQGPSTLALNGSTITGNIGSLAAGASATIVVVASPNGVGSQSITATATSDGFDLNPANNAASGSINGTNVPGTFDFGTPLEIVGENAGTVVLPITRSGGTLGSVTLTYSTSDGSGRAGVNYVATTGTVTFAAGQTTATISIPILDDRNVDGPTGFFVTLSNPTAGSLGASSVVAVLVGNTDIDTIPPAVSALRAVTSGSAINGFVITFDKAMDPTRAQLATNYHIFLSNADLNGRANAEIPVAGAFYDPTTFSVLIVPGRSLPSNRFYQIVANGSFGAALTDLSGNALYGSSGPNSNYDVFYGLGGNLRYVDSHRNAVTINIAGGGSLQIVRGANGDAAVVSVLNAVAGRTKLTGSVARLGRTSSGHTTIGLLQGLGTFGQVKSNLTTPGFYVISAPLTSTLSAASVSATAVTVTPAGATPKARAIR